MADDQDKKKAEVKETADKPAGSGDAAELSTKTQEKSTFQKNTEQKRQQMREEYRTVSSADLPKLNLKVVEQAAKDQANKEAKGATAVAEAKPQDSKASDAKSTDAKAADAKSSDAAKPAAKVDEQVVTEKIAALKLHMTFMGDADEVIKILKNSPEAERNAIKERYKLLHGRTLEEDLKDTFEGLEQKKILSFLDHKDAAAALPAGVNREHLLKDVVDLQSASKRNSGMFDTDNINKILAGKSADEIKAMDALYKERYGITLNEQFETMPPFHGLDKRLVAANQWKAAHADDKLENEAKQLVAFSTFVLRNEDKVKELLVGKTEAELKDLDRVFKKNSGQTIEEHLKESFEEPQLSKLLALLHHKDSDLSKLSAGVDRAQMRAANEEITNLKEIGWYKSSADIEDYYKVFAGKKPEEIDAMKQLFQERYGESLEEHLKEKLGFEWKPLPELLAAANKWHEGEKAFESNVAKVDQHKMEELAEQVHDVHNAKPPTRYYGMKPVVGWEPGEHPAEKLVQNLSTAELKALQDSYREKYGYELKDTLVQIPFGAGDRLRRTFERDHGGALDKLNTEERADAVARAETLYRAMIPKDQPGGLTPRDAVFAALEKQPEEKRKAIAEAFREMSGESLESWLKDKFSGEKEEKALNFLKFGSRDEAANLHHALTDKSDTDVRSMIMTRNSKEIEELDKLYKDHYGVSMKDAILQSDGLDADTKKAMEILLKGSDYLKAHPQEWNNLINISMGDLTDPLNHVRATQGMNVGNIKMFKELMAAAPDEVRAEFMTFAGAAKITLAFADDKSDAMDYATRGHLSLDREIKKQIGFWSDDHDAINKAVDENHNDKDHKDYIEGARVFKKYRDMMSDSDRMLYEMAAKSPKYGNNVPDLPNSDDMTDDEKRVYARFRSINSALDRGLYNENGMKFRDRILYSGGESKVISDLDSLSFDDLQKLKSKDVREKYLKDHNIDIMSEPAQKKIAEAIDNRLKAQKPEDLKYADGKSLDSVIKPDRYNLIDSNKVVEGIQHMNLQDQQKYRNDAEFRAQVDNAVDLMRNDKYQLAARHILDNVAHGKYPDADWIDKINIEGGDKETDEPRVVRLVEQEFAKTPGLYERIAHPKTAEDEALNKRLDTALHNALDDEEYKTWAAPLLERGRLTIQEKMDIDDKKGNKKAVFADIEILAGAQDKASSEERRRIVNDEYYRNSVLKELPADQRDIALNMLKHGEERHRLMTDADSRQQSLDKLPADKKEIAQKLFAMAEKDPQIVTNSEHRQQVLGALDAKQRQVAEDVLKWGIRTPEDALRSYELGLGVSKDKMMETLKELTPDQNAKFRDDYAAKYHRDVYTVLTDELSGDDKRKALQEIRIDPVTAREALTDAKELVDKSNSGFGATFTKWWGSGAGDLGADKILQLQAKIEAASADGKVLSVEDAKKLAADAVEYAQLFDAAKARAADEFANLVIGAASFVVPGGMSLRLLLLATGGGLLKVGIKEAIAGNATGADFVSGFVATGLSALGPGEIAGALRLGERVAIQAGERVAVQGGKLLAEGAEKKIAGELRSAAANAFAHGEGVIEDKVLNRIVTQYAREGATDIEKAALRKMIVSEFENAVKTEVRQGIKNAIVREGLGVGAGFVGGFAGGVTEAAFHWDASRSFSDNMSELLEVGLKAGAMGAGGALVLGNAFKFGGKAYRAVFSREASNLAHMGAQEVVAVQGEYGIARPKDAPAPSTKPVEVAPNQYSRVGESDYFVSKEGVIYKKVGEGTEGKIKLAVDEHASLVLGGKAAEKAAVGAGQAEISTGKANVYGSEKEVVSFKVKDGTTELYEQGGWYYPVRERANIPLDRGAKVHVFAKGPEDLARLQEVLIPALQHDPELLRMIPEWKTLDPRFKDPELARTAARSTDGAAFTIGVKEPGDLAKVQHRIDEILSQHPELKLGAPPKVLNSFAGETNRVGVVRDFWPASELASETRLSAVKIEEYRKTLGVEPGAKFSAEELGAIERGTGMKLRYDESGNLLVRESGARVDTVVVNSIHESLGVKTNERLSEQQLRQVESKSGLKQGSLVYDQSGHLVLKGTPGESRTIGNDYFMQELKSERQMRGVDYQVTDPKTNEVRTIRSEGLTDQPAMYKLSKDYGVEPTEAYVQQRAHDRHATRVSREHGAVAHDGQSAEHSYKPGEVVSIGGKKMEVIGRDGDVIAVREPGAPGEVSGKGIRQGEYDLAHYTEVKVGDTVYYRDETGAYHRINKKGELVEDMDVEFTPRASVSRTEHGTANRSEAGRSGHETEAPSRTTRDTVEVEAVRPIELDELALTHKQREVFDLADIPPDERPMIREWIQQNRMAQDGAVTDFAQRVSDATHGWTDMTQMHTDYLAAQGRFREAMGRYENDVANNVFARTRAADGSMDAELRRLLYNPVRLRQVLEHGPSLEIAQALNMRMDQLDHIFRAMHFSEQELAGLTDVLRVREATTPTMQRFHREHYQRLDALQHIVDDFAHQNGLPPVRVSTRPDEVMGGASGLYNDSDVMLKLSYLVKPNDPARMAATLYHELVHSEQNLVMLRRLVDAPVGGGPFEMRDPNLPPRVTAEQMNRLHELHELQAAGTQLDHAQLKEMQNLTAIFESIQSDYLSQSGQGLSLRRLRDVLNTPPTEGMDLSPFRGNVLMQANLRGGASAEIERSLTEIGTVTDAITALRDADGARNLIGRLSNDDGTLVKQLFGRPDIPPDVVRMILAYRKTPGQFPAAQAQTILERELNTNLSHVRAYYDAHYRHYISGIHETEAAVIDRLIANEFRRLRQPAPRNTRPMGAVAGEDASEVTGVHRRAVPDAADDETTGVHRAAPAGADDETTGVHRPTRNTQPLHTVPRPRNTEPMGVVKPREQTTPSGTNKPRERRNTEPMGFKAREEGAEVVDEPADSTRITEPMPAVQPDSKQERPRQKTQPMKTVAGDDTDMMDPFNTKK